MILNQNALLRVRFQLFSEYLILKNFVIPFICTVYKILIRYLVKPVNMIVFKPKRKKHIIQSFWLWYISYFTLVLHIYL